MERRLLVQQLFRVNMSVLIRLMPRAWDLRSREPVEWRAEKSLTWPVRIL